MYDVCPSLITSTAETEVLLRYLSFICFYRYHCHTATMGACLVTHPTVHTMNMVKSMVPAMDVANVSRPTMDASLVVVVCCTDGIDCWITGSTVALDRCVAVMDGLVVNRLLLDSIVIPGSLRPYGFGDVAIVRRTLKIVCHNMMHRQQSNCKRMAFVRRPPMLPAEHVQMPVTFDVHTMILMLQQQRPLGRIVCSRSGIYRLDAVLTSNPYKTDHGNHLHRRHPTNLCHLMCHLRRASSCDLHNSNRGSLKQP